MPAFLKEFKFGWKALNAALNEIADAVNRNSPLEGDGIHLDEHGQQGVSINATNAKGGGNQDQSGGGGGGGTAPTYTQITINGVQWKDVTIIDPATCAQSTLTVLAQGAGSVTFDITLS